MSYYQKLMLAIPLLVFCTTSAIANTLYTKNIHLDKPELWELDQNTWQYVSWPDKNVKVDFYVNALVKGKDGKMHPADTVTLGCGGVISKVIPNTHTICKLKAGDEIKSAMMITVAPEDFSQGSAGWYIAKKVQ